MKRFLLIVSVVSSSACGVLPGENKGPSSKSDKWEYEYSENNCSTGKVSGEGRQSQCEALRDDKRNNYCASATRAKIYAELCGEHANSRSSDSEQKNQPDPNNPPPQKVTCGYQFNVMEDSTVVRAVLRGTWVSRSSGLYSENALGETRSYKQGFFFDFTAGDMSEVRVYHKLNGADLIPAATSVPLRGSEIVISERIASGIYQGWHLVQWKTGNDRCTTIAVGLERRNNELQDTLLVIGPKMFWSSNTDQVRTVDDFFRDGSSVRRDFLSLGFDPLPRWEQSGL